MAEMTGFAKVWHSIGTRIFLILLAMATTTAGTLAVGFIVTRSIAANLSELVDAEVPAVLNSVAMMGAFGDIRAELTDFTLAVSPDELRKHYSHFEHFLAEAQADLRTLSPRISEPLKPLLDQMAQAMAAPVDARIAAFDRRAEVQQSVASLYDLSATVGGAFAAQQEAAQLSMKLLGERSTLSVGRNLTQLVDVEFVSVQAAIQARADLATLSSAVVALASGAQASDAARLRMRGHIAAARLGKVIERMTVETDLADAMRAASLVLERGRAALDTSRSDPAAVPALAPGAGAIGNSAEAAAPAADAATDLRQAAAEFVGLVDAADAALSLSQQKMMARITTLASDAADKNSNAVQALIASQVSITRRIIGIDGAIKGLTGMAFQAALAEDEAELTQTEERLSAQIAVIEPMLAKQDRSVLGNIRAMLVLTDPATGVVAHQRAFLAARENARTVSWSTEELVSAGVERAVAIARDELSLIQIEARQTSQLLVETRQMFSIAGVISLAILLLATALSYLMVVRPLMAVAHATSRLAGGDLAATDHLRRSRSEIGEMTSALGVFRDGLIDKVRLEQEERASQAARVKAETAQLLELAAQASREAVMKAEQDQRHHDLEAAEAAKRDALRLAADQERQAREAVQTTVVNELAGGLRSLADGNLRLRITTAFGEGYDQLRQDFNAASAKLEGVVGSIRASVDSIHGGSDEISRGAADLSRRTEQTAAMLEQSAAALTELTASVESAAVGATEAARVVEIARTSAEASDAVVREAVQTMGAIEESSHKISTIVKVIDDIAFQTNLLALNAGVEAARAGDAGRGFAVVASEVRALSQRSSEAAREIADLISESGRQVTRGVSLVDQAGDALRNIVRSVVEISGHVGRIATSAREQSTGISEINSAIGQLDQSTQQNAVMVQQTTAASVILAEEAQALSHTVAQFSIHAAGDALLQQEAELANWGMTTAAA